MSRVLQDLETWFAQGGNKVFKWQVKNAVKAGNAERNPTEESSIAKEQTLGDLQFCELPIQNSAFTLTGGILEGLLKPLIRCPKSEIEILR